MPEIETPPLESVWSPGRPVDIGRTLSPLRRGGMDPTMRVTGDGLWRTSHTPHGPVTILLRVDTGGSIHSAAWGSGAEWATAQIPELLGARDDWTDLDVTGQPLLQQARRANPGMRIPRTTLVMESLIPAVLEQRVVGMDARRSWRELVTAVGRTPPGPAPAGIRVLPEPPEWGRIPSWEWHRCGVDPGRAATIGQAVRVADGLQRTIDRGPGGPAVVSALRTVPGIGYWTAAETMQRAHGDPDTVSVGDYHLASVVGWALIGKPVDDDGMLELLEPWAGHRYRIVRLIESSGFRPPRFGPRSPRLNHRRH